jgi:hypothetical protein
MASPYHDVCECLQSDGVCPVNGAAAGMPWLAITRNVFHPQISGRRREAQGKRDKETAVY